MVLEIQGVEVVEPNTKDNRVIVKEKNCDLVKIAEQVKRKSGKHVDIISPLQKKQQEKKPEVTKTVLKIHLHCEGCAKEVKHCILKIAGDIWIGFENGAENGAAFVEGVEAKL
ncbi:hypothetical protein Tco_0128464 [Tanacetum coccineum]